MTYLSNSGDMFDGCCGILNRTIAQSLKMGKKVQFKIHLCIGIYLGGCIIAPHHSFGQKKRKNIRDKTTNSVLSLDNFFLSIIHELFALFFLYFRALCI